MGGVQPGDLIMGFGHARGGATPSVRFAPQTALRFHGSVCQSRELCQFVRPPRFVRDTDRRGSPRFHKICDFFSNGFHTPSDSASCQSTSAFSHVTVHTFGGILAAFASTQHSRTPLFSNTDTGWAGVVDNCSLGNWQNWAEGDRVWPEVVGTGYGHV